MFKKLWIPITVICSTVIAQAQNKDAGLFVEPGITYELGKTEVNFPSPLSNSKGDVKGFGLSAKLGFHINEVLFVAADARYSMPTFSDNSTGYNEQATAYNLAPVVGIQMADLGLRVWGSYVVTGQLDPKSSSAFDVKFSNATGYRIGAGFRLEAISFNLEYQDLSYGTTVLQNIGGLTAGTNFDSVTLKDRAWIASVSFPIQL